MPAACPILKAAKIAGEKYFFTGRPCIRGHINRRFVSTGACLTCHNERSRRFRKEHPERAKKNLAASRKRNPDYWRKIDPEKRLAAFRRYQERHREKIFAKLKSWRFENPERYAAYQKRWREENRGRLNAYHAERKFRKMAATPTFGQEGIRFLYEMAHDLDMTVDHEIPLKHSRVCGLHVLTNLRLMSKSENSRKHNIWQGTR